MWRHPKYYKELRKRNKLDQAISLRESETSAGDVRLVRAYQKKPQAQSHTHQATSISHKLQATSHKLLKIR